MKTNSLSIKFAIACTLIGITINAQGAATDLTTAPLITSTSATLPILPNVFLMMDDSGSMAWDYMPDNAGNFNSPAYGGASNQCNGVYYDPGITYKSPAAPTPLSGVVTTSGSAVINYSTTASYSIPPQVGQVISGNGIPSGAKIISIQSATQATLDSNATASYSGIQLSINYPNSSFTGAWTNGYNTGGSTVNLNTSFVPAGGGSAAPAYYYRYIGTQTSAAQKDYYNTPNTFYTECSTSASSSTITVSGSSATTISGITVNGIQILPATTVSSSGSSTVAGYIAAGINACNAGITGSCGVAGYSATVSGSVVTIWPPSAAAAGFTPSIAQSGTMTTAATAFPASPKFIKVNVSAASGPLATDERTNFANWYSYYRTRILMMKTSTGLAFKSICNDLTKTCGYRVGMATMNNNGGSDFLPLDTFNKAQKAAWYAKLYSTSANNSTPLREALSNVGRMYAMKLPGNSLNGVTVVDPIQYSCQQNFTILTTDGFWNGSTTYKLDGSTVGNQDGTEVRPMYDGSLTSSTTTTPYTTVQQIKSVTSGVVTTNTWSKQTNSIGADCSIAATAPANTTAAYMSDNGYLIALGLQATSPNTNRCMQLGGSGANTAWICRGSNNGGNPAVSQSSVTDSTGKTWYLVASSTSLASNCVNDQTAFNNTNDSSRRGACPGTPSVSGKLVTTTPASQNETISGATTTDISNYTANQSTTQTTTNGVVGPVSALTPSTLSYVYTNNVSSTSTAPTSDAYGTWTTGAASTVCTASASLPAAGTTTPAITASSATAGSTTTTVLSTVGPTAGTPTTTTAAPSGGTSNTLADVAEYYYITDLRTAALGNNLSGATGTGINGTDVSLNNVPKNGLDSNPVQHMTTFTLGLGARGRMVFDPNYPTQNGTNFTPADFFAVKQGSTAGTGICSWQSTGSCTWPTPASDAIENVDDLWHAAVNGRGLYFSATNPSDLATGLSTALSGVSARTGASAAATTSNAFVTQNDNFMFRTNFQSQKWYGELLKQEIDVNTGVISPTIIWSAQSLLDAKATRNIWFYDSSVPSTQLSSFSYTNLSAAQKSYFNSPAIDTLSQLCTNGTFSCLPAWQGSTPYTAGKEYRNGTTWYHVNTAYTSGTTFGSTDTANASVIVGAAGSNLVNFIRGDRSNEGAEADTTKYFRQRTHVLGDIVDSESIYVKGALASFTDFGYSAFTTAQATRQAMVYVGANDGMLHAFYAANATGIVGGDEAWAYIPTAVMNNLYILAGKDYGNTTANLHQFFVDGTPVVADICVSSCTNSSAVWKTILVGGLNFGGKSYFALDITDPANPKALWEFTNANMGYTYGNPRVVKLKDGTWVVLLTSGYNNLGDGVGHLFVVNAATGTLINDIPTGVGDSITPSGLARIDAPVASPGIDATAIAAYGGDLLGNVWRFDVNGDLGASGFDAQLLATLTDSNTPTPNVQPITAKPIISLVGSNYVVYISTGKYLGASDLLTPATQQSFYAIKDSFPAGTTPSVAIYGNPRTQGTFVHQTLTLSTCPLGSSADICTSGEAVFISSNLPVDFTTQSGWYFDFMHPVGEVGNTDSALSHATLVINTNLPNSSNCSVGGDSYQYQIDYKTGGSVSSSPSGIVGSLLYNELTTRPVVATFGDGTSRIYSQGSGGGIPSVGGLWKNSPGNSTVRRTSWRELTE
jgi:type IV pilus assembly protein PilY1